MIRLVASDIDGTLLHGEETTIAPVIFREIQRLRAKGILFCPASGRQYSSLRRLFSPVADQLTYLCENGAVVYGAGSPGPVLGKTPMPRPQSLALCEEILALPSCEVLISGANTSYLCPKQADIVDHMRYFVGNNVSIVPSPEDIGEEILKVSAYCREGAVGVEPLLSPRWSGTFHCAVAGERWLDFTLADKGTGLRQLCSALDIALEEVVAFGDNYNDLSMLHLAGRAYIMENADPQLRGQFPFHCHRVEDILRTL